MKSAVIHGEGVAACCCAYLLKQAGFRVAVKRSERLRLPAILLSDAALALIQGVFGDLSFDHSHPIRSRVVAWGPESQAVTVDHSARVVSEQDLLAKLWSTVDPDEDEDGDSDWTIFTSKPLPPGANERRFGTRTASVLQVTLRCTADPASCWIESLENGWLFLIPNAPGAAFVLAVRDRAESMIDSSRLIAAQIAERGPASGEFPAHPRILSSLCGEGWLACGTAAMAFDPICGDGTSHAVREAILAAAIIQAAAHGENPAELCSHYETRLLAGFGRHLALCSQFYKTGHTGPWWASELKSLEEGMAWCGNQLGNRRDFRYQLNGFELQPTAG
jgi:2-polyprenyl-6-methoxyphenol hydroxylase-like FAD-dependent oxidoreductase